MKTVERNGRLWVAAIALAAGLFCATVLLIPVAERHGLTGASWLRLGLRPACHQITDRCLDLGAGPLPVCARCSGLYLGGFAGILLTAVAGRRLRPPIRWVLAAAAPSIVDFGLGLLDLSSLANWPRFGVAFVPGVLLGLLLADATCSIVAANTRASQDTPIT